MTHRDHAPVGAPCWVDLSTPDVDSSRRFYAELFGWEAGEPSPDFGGYFMWLRDGAPIAGGMGPMGDMPAANAWNVYLATDDADKTFAAATAEGAQAVVSPLDIADLGRQLAVVDPTGAFVGGWQEVTFPGFVTLDEPGAPSWFELHTRDHARAVEFYRPVFRCDTRVEADTDEFRYTVVRDGDTDLAGIMDAGRYLPDGVGSFWTVYWEVADVDASSARARQLGGTVIDAAQSTPYGRIATVADPSGAQFRLRTAPGA